MPLSGNPAAALDYLLIDEALEAKKVVVEEVSEGGSVPELRMTNFADKVVLVVDGTELVGAKQNRIVNASFLIPPESITRIPVSCVEQGRWEIQGAGVRLQQAFRAALHPAGQRRVPQGIAPPEARVRLRTREKSGPAWRTCPTRWTRRR